MSQIGTPENPLRVAIVGAGPSGFYAAEHILKGEDLHAQVDLFDRLPTPFGLVRGGVAPDHPKIKSVIRVYEKTAARDGLPLLRQRQDRPRHRGRGPRAALPRDRLHGRLRDRPPARHPRRGPARQPRRHRLRRLVQRPPRLRRPRVRPLQRAGRGDRQRQRRDGRRPDAGADRPRAAPDRHRRPRDRAARPQSRSARSSCSAAAVRSRRPSPTRRSRSSGEMEDADVVVDPARGRARPGQRRLPRLRRGRQDDPSQRRDPARVLPAHPGGQEAADRPALPRLAGRDQGRRQGRDRSSIGRNELVEEGGTLRAKDTGEREELECGLVLRSVGYTGIPIEGVPFDEKRGLILNEGGRVLDSHDAGHKVGHYTAGWIKRGPSGVIGTNKKDALETVQHLLADVESPDPAGAREPGRRRRSRSCSPSAASATSASRTGRRSTRPRSAAASRTAVPGSSSSGSRRCSRPLGERIAG